MMQHGKLMALNVVVVDLELNRLSWHLVHVHWCNMH